MAGWLPNDQSIISRQPESRDERGQRYICRQIIIILRQPESREMRGDTQIQRYIWIQMNVQWLFRILKTFFNKSGSESSLFMPELKNLQQSVRIAKFVSNWKSRIKNTIPWITGHLKKKKLEGSGSRPNCLWYGKLYIGYCASIIKNKKVPKST